MTERTERPTSADKWYYPPANIYANCGYGMPNCTAYAWGRRCEIEGKQTKCSTRNAEDWWAYSDGYPRGQTPKIGAVACWRKGKAGDNSDGAGHVAIVERINADGSIVTSESGWKSSAYWWRTTRSGSNWGQSAAYTFQGFIYLPGEAAGSTADAKSKKTVNDATQVPTLARGSTDDTVRALQILLNGYGYDCGKPDGLYGRNTQKAVASFQSDHSLSSDGVCGPQTWAALLGIR